MQRTTLALFLICTATAVFAQSPAPRPAANAASTKPEDIKPEDLCTISGTVFNAVSGEPIGKALLTLSRSAQTASNQTSYTTLTDTGGKFAMKELPPGSYRLSAQRSGFVTMQSGAKGPNRPGTTLVLSAGQKMSAVDFKLIPHGVIAGRVRDEDGDPVSGAAIAAMRYQFSQGRKQLTVAATAATNDLGEYRIFGLAPGRYYVTAKDSTGSGVGMEDHTTSPRTSENYITTFYPGSADVGTASAVDLAGGRSSLAIDIKLVRGKTLRVSGRVVNVTGSPNGYTSLILIPRQQLGYFTMLQPVMGPQGQFDFRNVPPGWYGLLTTIRNDDNTMQPWTVRQSVEVGGQDIKDLVITVGKGFRMPGSFRVEGTAPMDFTTLRTALILAESSVQTGGLPASRVDVDGKFAFDNVNVDHYNVNVSGLPAGFYVKSIQLGSEDALEQPIDTSHGAAGQLTVILGTNAGQLDGVVMGADQKPLPGALVVLIPDSEKRRLSQQFYRTATTDQNGKYLLKDADPGNYRLYAWEDLEQGAFLDPDVVEPVRAKGIKIEIAEGSRLTQELKAIPAN